MVVYGKATLFQAWLGIVEGVAEFLRLIKQED